MEEDTSRKQCIRTQQSNISSGTTINNKQEWNIYDILIINDSGKG